jgi:hypothetical protein
MGSGDYLTCSSNIVVNEDLSATVTLELCNVCYKSMLSVTSKPEEWIKDMTHNRARKAGDIIYKQEFDRHLENGTLPPNATKASLILAHEFPVVVESLSEPVLDDPLTPDLEQALEAEKEKTKNLESRLAFLETAVASLIS